MDRLVAGGRTREGDEGKAMRSEDDGWNGGGNRGRRGGGRRRAEKRGFEIVLVLWVRNSYSTAALVQRVAQLVVGRSLLLLFWFWYIRTLSSPPWYPPSSHN